MADINETINLKINVEGGESMQNLKTQIREAKQEVEKFEAGSAAFIRASQNVAKLSDKLDDVNDQVKLLKGDSLERVAGGFKGIGSAILDLDVGRLKASNDSLKGIDFKSLTSGVKDFGKELLVTATNPFFLIPAAIGLIIANFDKLVAIFPGLGAAVDGVKAIFEKLIDFFVGLINYAGDLYEEFKPIINILFPITGLIEGIIDLLVEEANSAEASSKRRVEAEAKYKDSIEESNKSLGESRRRILVLTGQLSEEEAEKERLKEEFITNFLKANEEARTKIKEAASVEEKEVIAKDLALRLNALKQEYSADLIEVNKNIKDKSDAEKNASTARSVESSNERKEEARKVKEDNEKASNDFQNQKKQLEMSRATEDEKIIIEAENKKIALKKSFNSLSIEDQTDQEKYLKEQIRLIDEDAYNKQQETQTKRDEAKRVKKEKELEQVKTDEAEVTAAQTEASERRRLAKEAVDKKVTDDEARIRKLRIDTAWQTADNIVSILKGFGEKNRKAAIAAFNLQKGIDAAKAGIATYNAATQAYAAMAGIPVVGPALGAVAAAAAIGAGLVNVRKILSAKFDSPPDTGGSPPPAAPPPAAAPEGAREGGNQAPVGLPTFNLGGGPQIGGASNMLGTGILGGGQAPVKVFVTETDISNVQGKVQTIQGNSLFGG